MYRNININLMESLSLLLVTSFFIFHNIYLVLIGVFLAYLLINKDNLEISVRFKKKKILENKDETIDDRKSEYRMIESENRASTLSLVETIEEYGFIPNANEKDKGNAA